MITANEHKLALDKKTETIEYNSDKDTYIINISFNAQEIIFNIKNGNPYQYAQFESKFNFSDLKQISLFFGQFTDVNKIGNLYINLLKGKKIIISHIQDIINLSFLNITDEKINLSIKKKELIGDEKYDKLSEIVNKLINEVKELKEENEKMRNEINQLNQFKLDIEEKIKKKEKKYSILKGSSILKDKQNVDLISNWIEPERNISYKQIYKATRDGGTGTDFHKFCDNKGPTLTLIEATNGYIFGGYITISWESPEGWTYKGNDNNAFIFSINNKQKFPIKDNSKVIYNYKLNGPDFGCNDIYLEQTTFLNTNSSCGQYSYKAPPKILAGGSEFQVKELEVYSVQFE